MNYQYFTYTPSADRLIHIPVPAPGLTPAGELISDPGPLPGGMLAIVNLDENNCRLLLQVVGGDDQMGYVGVIRFPYYFYREWVQYINDKLDDSEMEVGHLTTEDLVHDDLCLAYDEPLYFERQHVLMAMPPMDALCFALPSGCLNRMDTSSKMEAPVSWQAQDVVAVEIPEGLQYLRMDGGNKLITNPERNIIDDKARALLQALEDKTDLDPCLLRNNQVLPRFLITERKSLGHERYYDMFHLGSPSYLVSFVPISPYDNGANCYCFDGYVLTSILDPFNELSEAGGKDRVMEAMQEAMTHAMRRYNRKCQLD